MPRPRPDPVPEGRGRGRSRLQFQILLRRDGEVHPFGGPRPPNPLTADEYRGHRQTPFDLTQAYLTYNAPLGKGLQFSFGKFVAPETAEVIEAIDNFNYSRSFLFNYAVPFTLTGVRTYYAFSDAFNAAFYLVNAWDRTTDNNTGKTVGLSFGVTPVQPFNMAFNFLYGPERDSNNSNNRFLFDWVGTLNATKNLTFVLNTDWATEQGVLTALGPRDARWYGIAGYAKYSFNDWFAVALRGEWFNDPEGVRTYSAMTPAASTAADTTERDRTDTQGRDSHHRVQGSKEPHPET